MVLRVAVCQLSSHIAIGTVTSAQLEEPFVGPKEYSLWKLKSAGLDVTPIQTHCRETYIAWQTKRLAAILSSITSSGTNPDLLIFPEGSVPFESLGIICQWSKTNKATVLAGTHTPILISDAAPQYIQLGVTEAVLASAKKEEWTSVLPVIRAGSVHLVPKVGGLSPGEQTSVGALPTGSSPQGDPITRSLVEVGDSRAKVFCLICSEALQENIPVPLGSDLVAILSCEPKPSRFSRVIATNVENGRFAAYSNNGSFGGSMVAWVKDRRFANPFNDMFPTGLPEGDALLMVDLNLAVRAVHVGVSTPQKAGSVVKISAITYANQNATVLAEKIAEIKQLSDSTERAQGTEDTLTVSMGNSLQRMKYNYLLELDRRGIPEATASWEVFGQDIILDDVQGLENLESNLAEYCYHELESLFGTIPLDSPGVDLAYMGLRKACASKFRARHSFPQSADPYKKGILPGFQEHLGFAGRSREIQEFDGFLQASDFVLNYHGTSGIGKSWFLNYLLKRFSTSRKTNENFALAFIDCKEINGDILRFMDGVAFNVGAIRVPHYVKRRNAVGEDEASNFSLKSTRIKTLCNALFADLAKASEEESILIFVDSFEKVPQAAFGKEISEGLRNHFGNPGQNWLKIVIGGQNSIRADEGWERFRCVEIKHFDRDELEEFADKNLGIKEPEILDYLEKEWKGDPLELGKLVHLYRIDQGATIEAQLTQIRGLRKKGLGAADSEFLDRLASSLDAGTMNALRCCCCFSN